MRSRPVPARSRAAAARPVPVVLDSSCWLEWLADTPRASLFEEPLSRPHDLVVPMLIVYEVTKKLRRECGDDIAWQALALMQQGQLVDVDLHLALQASGLALPLADSLIYATAQRHGAELWTQDAHFKGLSGVRWFDKSPA